MTRTIATLNVNRTSLAERPLYYSRRASDIHAPQEGKGRVYKWPHTGSWTLQPMNLIPSFVETLLFEEAKFRLSDVFLGSNGAEFWQEVPHYTKDGVEGDYFFRGIVSSLNYVPHVSNLWTALVGLTGVAIVAASKFLESRGVAVMRSRKDLPANQGYHLRFFVEGRQTFKRAEIYGFFFGDFYLRLNSDGTAELHQTADFVDYGLVYTFHWAMPSQIHGFYHEITIAPHARNKIEFLCSGLLLAPSSLTSAFSSSVVRAVRGGGCYNIPSGTSFDDETGLPKITKAGKWTMVVHQEFRPDFQVSRIVFDNGSDGLAGLMDSPVPLEFAPTYPLYTQPDGDLNGCTIEMTLGDYLNKKPFVSDGTNQTPQFVIFFHGLGDICNGAASTRTPELYGYCLDKPAGFITTDETPVDTEVQSVGIDFGDAPESERLTVHMDNADGQLDDFSERGDIPILVSDPDNAITFFEGTVSKVQAGEASAQHPRFLAMEAGGMVDQFLRGRWVNPPNFGIDPKDPSGRAWYWQEAGKRCFATAGFDPDTQVVFEDVFDDNTGEFIPATRYNFRLWLDGDAGGSRGGGDKPGEGHNEQKQLAVWWPAPDTPVHEFTDHLFRAVMGWNWSWDRSDHKWHIYKRPSAAQLGKVKPKAIYFNNIDALLAFQQGLVLGGPELDTYRDAPLYLHRAMSKETERPRYTTLLISFSMQTSQFVAGQSTPPAPAELNDLLKSLSGSQPTPKDTTVGAGSKRCTVAFDNPNGYASPKHPHPDKTSPDYLGRMRARNVRLLKCTSRDSVEWIGRRLYEDLCFGRVWRNWDSEWGDAGSVYLRKWDVVMINTGPDGALERWVIDRVEPDWSGMGSSRNRRARFRASKYRPDAAAPR